MLFGGIRTHTRRSVHSGRFARDETVSTFQRIFLISEDFSADSCRQTFWRFNFSADFEILIDFPAACRKGFVHRKNTRTDRSSTDATMLPKPKEFHCHPLRLNHNWTQVSLNHTVFEDASWKTVSQTSSVLIFSYRVPWIHSFCSYAVALPRFSNLDFK